MAQRNCNILNLNVRGLNDGARQDAVNELVRNTGSSIVCLQETKLQVLDQNVVRRTVGAKFANSYAVLPAIQTRGGILLAVNEDYFDLSDIRLSTNAITASLKMRADGISWQVTVVYAITALLQFLQELKNIPPPDHSRWLILGDFNLIYQAEDKNNSNLNRRLMGSFKAAIDNLRLKEIKLNGRRVTWSTNKTTQLLLELIGSCALQNGS
jgi:exonuclease III